MKLSVSSDKVSSLRNALLLLNLSVADNSGTGAKKELLLELPKEDLDSLIKTLEKVNEVTIR
jgi:hypothetical protein